MGQINSYQDLVQAIDEHGIEATVKAYRKPPLHTRILRELYDLYLDQPQYIEFLAHYPLIPSDLAERIGQALSPEQVNIACGLASNPRSPQQTLNRLGTHANARVRLELAANPNLTPKECQLLAADDNVFVRAKLAGNPALPTALQFLLSADDSECVRLALASRKTLDPDIAVQLGRDQDTLVRAAIINSWTQDPELLHLWAERDDVQNQQLLLQRNKKLEPSLLDTLRLSPHPAPRKQALKTADLSGPHMLFLAESDNTEDRMFLAEQEKLPASIQRILAQDSAPQVRRRLAANACIDPGIAQHIATSDDLAACRTLAKNPAIEDDCIAQLCTHADDNIALLVTYRSNLNETHRQLLLNHRPTTTAAEHIAYQGIGYKQLSTETATALAQAKAPSLRRFAAQSPKLEKGTLQRLSEDISSQVRQATATNPTTPDFTLQTLTKDHCRDVVFAAEDNIGRRLHTQHGSTEEYQRDAADDEESSPLLKKIVKIFTD